MVRLRGGSGLGDSLYLRPFVEYLESQNREVTVMTNFPEVFTGTNAKTEVFNRNRITMTAHYPQGKYSKNTNQWQDIQNSAKLGVPLRFTWNTVNQTNVDLIRRRADGRPIVLVIGGREPMGRSDGFGRELLPLQSAFNIVMDELQDCFTIRIGKGPAAYSINTHWDLSDRTTVTDLLDLGKDCDAVVGQCSYAVPLAEGFDKPLLAVWAAAGLASRVPYIKTITPKKVLSKLSSWFVIDDQKETDIRIVARNFRDESGFPGMLYYNNPRSLRESL